MDTRKGVLKTSCLHHFHLQRTATIPIELSQSKISRASANSSIALAAVLVSAQRFQRLIVTVVDSITDGYGSTLDADRSWSSDLLRRLLMAADGSQIAVVNAGISGNRLLSDGFRAEGGFGAGFGRSALARFARDALALPGVTHIVLPEGINDIGFPGVKPGERLLAGSTEPRTLDELINGYRQLISRAHARGIKLIVATLTPFEGVDVPGYYSDAKESTRQAVNQWIRNSGSFDALIDFDMVLRDPQHPSRLRPEFASKDHLHPNDAGYQAMADAIDLSIFR